MTLAEFVDVYLQRHERHVRARTISTLRDRLRHAIATFGDVPLRELERMPDEIAAWQAKLPARAGTGSRPRFAKCWRRRSGGSASRQPGQTRRPEPEATRAAVRAFTRAEIDAIAAELSPRYRPLPRSAPPPA